MENLADILGPDGLLAQNIEGYSFRPAQLEMAEAVLESIEQSEHLIVEAGTGTGKTYAYLLPAILSGKKVIVSTGTKNLQDQLFSKDIPSIRKMLELPIKAALLKGRSNYLCLFRMENALESTLGYNQSDAIALSKIERWSKRTPTGDVSDVTSVSESSSIWPQVTSTVDNCLGQECPVYDDCYLVKARRKAQEADLLVINHHLLCADWKIKEGGFGELLPEAEVVICDEAHQIAEVASQFLGSSVSARQLIELAKEMRLEHAGEAGSVSQLPILADQIESEVAAFRLLFGEPPRRGSWQEVSGTPQLQKAFEQLSDFMESVGKQLEPFAAHTKGLESCWKRSGEIYLELKALNDADDRQWIRWFETYRKTFTLSRTPLDVARSIGEQLKLPNQNWVFTSATLSVAGQFDHFSKSIGLDKVKSEKWDSPFDYPNQSLFYHPKGLPMPSAPGFTKHIVEEAIPVLEASQGRAFFLFTSHRALREAAEILAGRLDYPLLIQGDQPKQALLDQFRSAGNAILLGTSSFWEGVDMRGAVLSCVIIDKLPFASPGDPVLSARLDALKKQGQNPFMSWQVPHAAIALKQGVGRLIRDEADRGVFMFCDPRLLKSAYGQKFLDSLPEMKRTRDISDVEQFFSHEDKELAVETACN
jgi:ATP-dependent DNA helicase DinG